MLFSGIDGAPCGLAFFIASAMLGVFPSVFILMRGASLIFYAWNAGKAMAAQRKRATVERLLKPRGERTVFHGSW